MKKNLSLLLASTLLFASMNFINASAYTTSNWMGSLDQSKSLSQISIPGTHDSGARVETISGTAKCQNLSITEQLNSGVRYLDIRCRHIENIFAIHHGMVSQKINFGDVLDECINFLHTNPSERILMSVQEEYKASDNTRGFDDTLMINYITPTKNMWYTEDKIPTLEESKGKIVLIKKFNSNKISGITWDKLKIQDDFVVKDNTAKWNSILSAYNSVKNSQNSNLLYINNTSGYKPLLFGIPSIPKVSDDINSRLRNYFGSNPKGNFGITGMDFVDQDLSSKIIATNF